MRIIAGAYKGSKLVAPGGSNTRPTSDRVKESLFSMLDGYGVLQAANVLDLFAGSGGLGFEAMSRGAAEVDFVDSAGASARAVEANAAKLGIDHSTRIHSSDVVSFLSSQRVPKQHASAQLQSEGHSGEPTAGKASTEKDSMRFWTARCSRHEATWTTAMGASSTWFSWTRPTHWVRTL